jgi:[protein-PII] uridylyltransferase
VVNVVTWDRAGLFYKLAGAFSVAGLNILGREGHLEDRPHRDRHLLRRRARPRRRAERRRAGIVREDHRVRARLELGPLPGDRRPGQEDRRDRYLYSKGGETLHSSFPPTVDVYHEISMQRTIVEVQARDQIGLLYRLAKAIFDFGFDITFARIGTERGVAIDTFYIESANHEPSRTPTGCSGLRAALTEVISPAQVPSTRAAERGAPGGPTAP